MDYIRRVSWIRYFWCFFTLHLLNLSVEGSETRAGRRAEVQRTSHRERLVEFIVEQILGLEDAFPESDDETSRNLNIKLDNFYPSGLNSFLFSLQGVSDKDLMRCRFISGLWPHPVLGITTPPPEC